MSTPRSGRWAVLEAIHRPASTNIIHRLSYKAQKHDFPREPDGLSQPFGSGAFAPGQEIPRFGSGIRVATDLTLRLRVNEGKLEIWPNSCSERRIVKLQRQLDGVKHESRSSRYENGLWSWSRAQKMPCRRAIECEDGRLRARGAKWPAAAEQPVHVRSRDFDTGGGACHGATRSRRKRGHPSDGAELAEVFTATGIIAARTTQEPP